MAAVSELASDVGTSAACQALDMPRASYYRRRVFAPKQTIMRSSPARALRPAEREMVLAQLHGERFQDRSPAAVYATLLDEWRFTTHRGGRSKPIGKDHLPNGPAIHREQVPTAIRILWPLIPGPPP